MFCGADANSREHLLPDWLRTVLPSDQPMIHFRQVGTDASARQEWERAPFREKVRSVCSACNSGWMSALEQEAKPLLRLPITRTPCAFTGSQQNVLATWAVKTSLVFQASQTDPIAPREHFAYVRDHRSPPAQVAVWLGSHYRARHDPSNGVFLQRPLRFESESDRIDHGRFDASDGYLNFLALGGVAFLLVGYNLANRIDVEYTGHLADGLIRIWPSRTPVVTWPPRSMLDRDLIEMITLPPSGFAVAIWPA